MNDKHPLYDKLDALLVHDAVAAVDWMTMTVKAPELRATVLAEIALTVKVEKTQGGIPKSWGFKGYRGLQINGLRWGTRADSDIIVLSGQHAHDLWERFASEMNNCSRLDLAVTCKLNTPVKSLVDVCYKWVTGQGKEDVDSRTRYSTVRNNQGGQTLYVGCRRSDQMGRLYDKGAEQGLDTLGEIWRYEVEFKKARAKKVFDWLIARGDANQSISEPIESTVYDWFDGRGVPPVWKKGDKAINLEVSAKASDLEKTLTWLSDQVRPTVGRLIELGWADRVYEALGLADIRDDEWVKDGFEALNAEVKRIKQAHL
jgi:DNA relaxase NicK